MFVRLDEYDFEEFLQRALPALERSDPLRLLELLVDKLSRAVRLSDAEGESYSQGTSTWVRDLEHPDPIDGTLAQLARMTSRVAIGAATTADTTACVFAILDRQHHEIFNRIRLRVLAAAGRFAPDRLDAFFSDRRSLEPVFRGREIAGVVREQFANASYEAQRAFVEALEAGPAIHLTDSNEDLDPAARDEETAAWQRRRLTWFRGHIPVALEDMAQRLGVPKVAPSARDEGLAEDGFYVGEGGFVGEVSPVSLGQLHEMTAEAFVDFVTSWRPPPPTWNSATREGLDRLLSEYATQHPMDALIRADAIVTRLRSADDQIASRLQALIEGLGAAVAAGLTLDWAIAFRMLERAWPEVAAHIGDEERRPAWQPWRWLGGAIVDFVVASARKSSIPAEQIASAWRLIGLIVNAEHLRDSSAGEPFKSFEDALTNALNNAAGRATEAVLEIACAEFRITLGKPEQDATRAEIASVTAPIGLRLRPVLEHALGWTGRAGLAARAVMGTYIPQIYLLDREWLLQTADRLFDRGTTAPLESPAWGAYLTRSRLFDDVFTDLRRWYDRAVIDMPALVPNSSKREHWSITQHLGEHVLLAYIRGLIHLDDTLLAMVFSQLPAQEAAHLSWQIFRGWTDAKRAPAQPVIERLLRFWRWRLDSLEQAPATEARHQELSGLTWLLSTPHLPERDVIALGLRTLLLVHGDAAARGAVWDRVRALAAFDIDATFPMAQLLIEAALARPNGYITIEQTESTLRRALSNGNPATRDAARRLINSLGERGHLEFGRLLSDKED